MLFALVWAARRWERSGLSATLQGCPPRHPRKCFFVVLSVTVPILIQDRGGGGWYTINKHSLGGEGDILTTWNPSRYASLLLPPIQGVNIIFRTECHQSSYHTSDITRSKPNESSVYSATTLNFVHKVIRWNTTHILSPTSNHHKKNKDYRTWEKQIKKDNRYQYVTLSGLWQHHYVSTPTVVFQSFT